MFTVELKVYIWPAVEQNRTLSTECSAALNTSSVWGNMERVKKKKRCAVGHRRPPLWRRRRVWHHPPWSYGTAHTWGVGTLGIISTFLRLKERLNQDGVVSLSLMWANKNAAWSDTESVICTDPKAGNLPADTVMSACDVTQQLRDKRWAMRLNAAGSDVRKKVRPV